jgi:hypothetical protein
MSVMKRENPFDFLNILYRETFFLTKEPLRIVVVENTNINQSLFLRELSSMEEAES